MQDCCWVGGPCTSEALLNKNPLHSRWNYLNVAVGEVSQLAMRAPCNRAPPGQTWPPMDSAWEPRYCHLPFQVKVHRNRVWLSKTVVQSLLISVLQMASFLPPVPLSFSVPLKPTIRRQERKACVYLTSLSPVGFSSDQKWCSFALCVAEMCTLTWNDICDQKSQK